MLGDGKTEYDQANDGEANSIGSCSVFCPIFVGFLLSANMVLCVIGKLQKDKCRDQTEAYLCERCLLECG